MGRNIILKSGLHATGSPMDYFLIFRERVPDLARRAKAAAR
jgi:hypothetical protein